MNYEKIYNSLISKARSEDRKRVKGGIYYEAHHIIPRCMGGEGKTSDVNHPNIVLLTAKEHYMAHRLLCEIYPSNKKIQYAMWCMINGLSKNKRYIPSGKVFERIKETRHQLIVNISMQEIQRKADARLRRKELRIKEKQMRLLTRDQRSHIHRESNIRFKGEVDIFYVY